MVDSQGKGFVASRAFLEDIQQKQKDEATQLQEKENEGRDQIRRTGTWKWYRCSLSRVMMGDDGMPKRRGKDRRIEASEEMKEA